ELIEQELQAPTSPILATYLSVTSTNFMSPPSASKNGRICSSASSTLLIKSVSLILAIHEFYDSNLTIFVGSMFSLRQLTRSIKLSTMFSHADDTAVPSCKTAGLPASPASRML